MIDDRDAVIDDRGAVDSMAPSAPLAVEWLSPEGVDPMDEAAGPIAIVRFCGEIDLNVAPVLRDSVLRETAQAAVVVIDLSSISFLDSAGVRLFDSLVGAYERGQLPFRLVAPVQGVARFTLKLCAFRADLIEESIQEALAALKPV